MGLAVPQAYRVIPPRGSLLDFDTVCRGQFKRGEYLGKVGGLGLTPGRGSARTAALNNLSAHFTPVFHSQAGTCQAETGQPIKVGRGEATVLLAQMQGRMQALEALCDSKLHRFADSCHHQRLSLADQPGVCGRRCGPRSAARRARIS